MVPKSPAPPLRGRISGASPLGTTVEPTVALPYLVLVCIEDLDFDHSGSIIVFEVDLVMLILICYGDI